MLIYFEDGKIVSQSGDVRVYFLEKDYYLEIGKELWAHTMEQEWYEKRVYPFSKGNVLEIGLGLGVCSRVILSNTQVKSLTTVEINKDVINVCKEVFGFNDKRWKIVNDNGENFLARAKKNHYDLMFLDYWIRWDQDAQELVKKVEPLAEKCLKKDGKILYWFDA